MPRNLDGLDTLRFVQRYADTRNGGLTTKEAEELLADKRRSENATVGDPMEDEDVN